MCGELTDKETISRLEHTLENQLQDQFEVLLYKKNSKSLMQIMYCVVVFSLALSHSLVLYFHRFAHLLVLSSTIFIS